MLFARIRVLDLGISHPSDAIFGHGEGADVVDQHHGCYSRARAAVILADVIAVATIAGAVVGVLKTAKGKPVVAEAKGEALAIVVVFNDDGPRHDSAIVLKEGVVVAVYVSVL